MPSRLLGHMRMALMSALLMGSLPARAGAVCHGDCTGDGAVSAADLSRIAAIVALCDGAPAGCAAVPGANKQCPSADFDGDGKVTGGDLTQIEKEEVLGASPDCEGGTPLGTRVLTIAQRTGFAPPTGFFSTGGSGGEVTDESVGWYIAQPLKLRAGPVNASTGIASVRVEEDVIFGGQVIQGGPTLCIKILAQGSSGQVDCDGGSPQDLLFTVDSHTGPCLPTPPCAADDPVVTPFTGNPSRPGAVTLSVMATVDNIDPKLSSPAQCVNHQFGPPSHFYFTTERTTARVNNVSGTTILRICSLDENRLCNLTTGCPAGKGTCSFTTTQLARTGTAFNCAKWTTTDDTGRLYTPLFGEDTAVGDTANLLLIGDK